ncbi:DUF11 domain-containing protein, partial [Streptomyces sp. NPDC004629]|uniref:DUF11 domain-containing protein n=1 Tax=Streptomyces sp. NPDC004629 TaxID=3364705 RepID=UPI00367B2343
FVHTPTDDHAVAVPVPSRGRRKIAKPDWSTRGNSSSRGWRSSQAWEGLQNMTCVRSHRPLTFMLAAGAAAGVLGLLGAPHAVAAEATADLSITKVGPTPAPDGRFSYQITIKNNGPDPSSGWSVRDMMGGHAFPGAPNDLRSSDPRCAVVDGPMHGGVPQRYLECKGGPLAAGSSTVIEVTSFDARVNYASVTGNEPDSNRDNNSATSVPIGDSPLVDPAVGAGAAAAVLAAGTTISLIRRHKMRA